MQATRFDIGQSSKNQLAQVLRALRDNGTIDYWAFSKLQQGGTYISVDFGPCTNLTRTILVANSLLGRAKDQCVLGNESIRK